MIQVALLTESQKNDLIGQVYTTNSYFNPIQDINDNWVISQEEITFCNNPQFDWVTTLSMIDYVPKPNIDLF